MLSLDDAHWKKLTHAYGAAEDIPERLRALARGDDRKKANAPRGDVWDGLWSALCHQGSVYDATYAALPHVVSIGAAREPMDQAPFWSFASAVATSSDRVRMPGKLRDDYAAAVRDAAAHARAALRPGTTAADARRLVGAVAGLDGERAIARAIEGLSDGELTPQCPECDHSLYVTLEKLPFVAHDEDPVGKKAGHRTDVATRKPRAAIARLASLVESAGVAVLAAKLLALDGDVTCPTCGESFSLIDHADPE